MRKAFAPTYPIIKEELKMSFKAAALVVLFLVYVYRLWQMALTWRSAKNPAPQNVADVYDPETYQKWRAYHAEKCRLNMVSSTVSFLVQFFLMLFDVYAAFAGLFARTPFMQMFAVLLLFTLSDAALLPVSYYDTMVIEEKYGFNRSTKKTFWMDQIKQFIISLVLIVAIGSVLMGLHQWLGDGLIIAFAVTVTLLMLFISFLYPFFSKIFNKFTPLEDGELKEKLSALLEKNGYRVRAIQVMDASKRSTKSNAYFTGFGKMKTIVLYDTLVQSMTPDEICAVFAHEMGHGLHKDTLKNQLLTFAQMLILGVLAFLTLRTAEVFTAFGFDGVNYGFALVLIMSVEFALISPLFGLFANWCSRRAEYRADAQAVKEGYGQALISGLKKLCKENFANLAPSPLLVKLDYSHPTLSQRIDAIEKGQASISL